MGIRGKIWCGIILILVVGFGIAFIVEKNGQKSATERWAEIQLQKEAELQQERAARLKVIEWQRQFNEKYDKEMANKAK